MHPQQVRSSWRRCSPLLSTYLIIRACKHAVTPLAETATFVRRACSRRRSGIDNTYLIISFEWPASEPAGTGFFRQALAGLRIWRVVLLRRTPSRQRKPAAASIVHVPVLIIGV